MRGRPRLGALARRGVLFTRGICGIGLPRSYLTLAHTPSVAYGSKTSRVLWQQRHGAVIGKDYRSRRRNCLRQSLQKTLSLASISCCPARRPSVVRGNTIAARQESGFKSGRVAVCAGRNSRRCSSPEQLGTRTENRSRCSKPRDVKPFRREIRGGALPEETV